MILCIYGIIYTNFLGVVLLGLTIVLGFMIGKTFDFINLECRCEK